MDAMEITAELTKILNSHNVRVGATVIPEKLTTYTRDTVTAIEIFLAQELNGEIKEIEKHDPISGSALRG